MYKFIITIISFLIITSCYSIKNHTQSQYFKRFNYKDYIGKSVGSLLEDLDREYINSTFYYDVDNKKMTLPDGCYFVYSKQPNLFVIIDVDEYLYSEDKFGIKIDDFKKEKISSVQVFYKKSTFGRLIEIYA